MRDSLQKWLNKANHYHHLQHFSMLQIPTDLSDIQDRLGDLYISLVGELFSCIKSQDTSSLDWAQMGNAFLQFATEVPDERMDKYGIRKEDAAIFSAASFYFGSYPASAYLAIRHADQLLDEQGIYKECYEFLARPESLNSEMALSVKDALISGTQFRIEQLVRNLAEKKEKALQEGPNPWIAASLLHRLIEDFSASNIRAVLPDGYDQFWSPLVNSFLSREQPIWEFFPSQIKAIRAGLLSSQDTFSLQMPTGSGKTALCELLLYRHLKTNADSMAVMLVPYRSLASELKGSLARRLDSIGIATGCFYGGSISFSHELHDFSNVRAIVATPEAFSGLLGTDPEFAKRVGLVIIDEGHLLDSSGRGVGLELLLTRIKTQIGEQVRFVFLSAVVPNMEEINAWLGGGSKTAIHSEYRPSLTEYAVLEPTGTGTSLEVALNMHPHEPEEKQFDIGQLLSSRDFKYINPKTGRNNVYSFNTIKSQVVAVARKCLSVGSVAIYSAIKKGDRGAIGVAKTIIKQLQLKLPLPNLIDSSKRDVLQKYISYIEDEYGSAWTGTQSLKHGFILHHGDIPQETREIFEYLIRAKHVSLVVCTSTLAEGVNLPIRTLILYSVRRTRDDHEAGPRLRREIKNLVGRAGRPGVDAKGLVICANQEEWDLVNPDMVQVSVEPIRGALFQLVKDITGASYRGLALNNQFLEKETRIHPLIDGVDSTLMELISEEIGEEEFRVVAEQLAAQTYAAQNFSMPGQENSDSNNVLRRIFALRSQKVLALRNEGKVSWVRSSGAKIRLVDSVENDLLPSSGDWSADLDPISDDVMIPVFKWAWNHRELHEKVRQCMNLGENDDITEYKDQFFRITKLWMMGEKFRVISDKESIHMDDLLAIYSGAISFSLQTLVEQGISLLEKRLDKDGLVLSDGVKSFPRYLQFGVPSKFALDLATSVRHRSACVQLGAALESRNLVGDSGDILAAAAAMLGQNPEEWRAALGDLVFTNTKSNLRLD